MNQRFNNLRRVGGDTGQPEDDPGSSTLTAQPPTGFLAIQRAYARMDEAFQCGTHQQFKEAEREFWKLLKSVEFVKGDWGHRG